jgi:hypothetical protein
MNTQGPRWRKGLQKDGQGRVLDQLPTPTIRDWLERLGPGWADHAKVRSHFSAVGTTGDRGVSRFKSKKNSISQIMIAASEDSRISRIANISKPIFNLRHLPIGSCWSARRCRRLLLPAHGAEEEHCFSVGSCWAQVTGKFF